MAETKSTTVGYRQLYRTSPFLAGPDVLAVQRRLKELGFDPYALDGVYGPMTESAVITFQRARRLQPNGVVDNATYRALGFNPTPPTPPAPGGPWGRPRDIRVIIDTGGRRLHVHSESGQPLRVYPCAVGKPSTPTPVGDWEILTKVVEPDWEVLGSRWMGLSVPTGNYGIHGTNNPASIGHAVSNGCVRLHNANAEELFDWATIGTPVKIVRSYTGGGSGGGPGGGSGGTPGGGSPGDGSGGSGGRPVLRRGSSGPYVREAQTKLKELGHYGGAVDGIFGPLMEGAVRAFQERRGLTVDGVIGPRTWAALGF